MDDGAAAVPRAGPVPPLVLGAAVAAVIAGVMAVNGVALLADGDTLWHLTTGELILRDAALPNADPYSFTRAGEPWIAKEWLSQLLLVAAERAGGWAGVVALTAIAGGSAFGILAATLARRWRPAAVVVAVGVAFVLTAPHLLARPHVLALPVEVAVTAAVFGAVDAGRRPPWWSLLLVVLWANLHAGVSLGVVLAGAAALDVAVRARRMAGDGPGTGGPPVLPWVGFAVATVAAACVTPYGPRPLLVTVEVLGLGEALAVIPEWQPQDLATLGAFEVVLLAALGAVLVRGVRLPLVRTLVVLGLLHLALTAVRNGELLGLLAPIVLAAPLAGDPAVGRDGAAPAPSGVRMAGALAVGGVLLAGVLAGVTSPRPPDVLRPTAALASATEAGDRLLHEYGFGGHLVAEGVPTFVDGRTELFGGPFVAAHAAALRLDDLDELDRLLVAHDIDTTMLRPATPLVGLLDRSPAWSRVHTDGLAVVHARTAPSGGIGLPTTDGG